MDVANYLFNKRVKIYNTLYFRLHKNDKHLDLFIYVFKSTNFIIICHFYVAHNIKNSILKKFMLVGFIINYVQICFHKFLKF
jgi:hypothetical protein